MKLEINQNFAQIGLRQTNPRTKLKQVPAKLRLKQSNGKLKINSKGAEVKIDQTKARAKLNHKHYKIFGKEIAKKGMQISYQAIATYAREGDELAAIEKDGQPIVKQAIEHAYGDKRELSLGWKQGPEYKVEPPQFEMDYKLGKIDLETQSHRPRLELKSGKVEVYQKQLPELEIKVIDEKV